MLNLGDKKAAPIDGSREVKAGRLSEEASETSSADLKE